ncbi:sortase [Patescibacteria group bacterium]|nr:sortase [Patescibacteria group bacterium]MCL5010251.1 sortase [Patescibacteria group bacterium]
MTKREIIKFLILRSIGNFLVLFALFGVGATFGPTLYYEALFRLSQARGVHYTVEQPAVRSSLGQVLKSRGTAPKLDLADVLSGNKEQVLTPIDTQFDILIPKIGANARVFPNVDPSNSHIFLPILQKGVAQAAGSVFPGMNGNIYLFAHSTDNFWDVGRYNAVFYLIKDLVPGDGIVIFFENQRYDYTVTGSRIVDPSNVSYLLDSQKQNRQQLILQTCWPPGTTWKRLLVFASPK